MYFYQYIFMCVYIGTYLFFHQNGAALPAYLPQVNLVVSWAFLAWAGFSAGRIIVDCIVSNAKGQMTGPNMRNGIILALLHLLPFLLMSAFMLGEGFKEN